MFSLWIFLADVARARGLSKSRESDERGHNTPDMVFRRLLHPRTGRRLTAVPLADYLAHVSRIGRLTPDIEAALRRAAFDIGRADA